MAAPEMFFTVIVTETSFSAKSGLAHTCLSSNFALIVLRVIVTGNLPAVGCWMTELPKPELYLSLASVAVHDSLSPSAAAESVTFASSEDILGAGRRQEASHVAMVGHPYFEACRARA